MASHTLQTSCVNGSERKYFLDKMYPNLCSVLRSYGGFFANNSSCEETIWPEEFFRLYGKPQELIKELHQYGRDNLALVNIFIQSPYVTKIRRDLAMTLTGYIANTGGLLGLCLGFSAISGIEIIFWFCCCCQKFGKRP